MIGEVVFMAVLVVFAGAIIWKSIKKKTGSKAKGKSCCE